MSRDYKKEYREYHAKPEQKKRRAGRNAARRYAIKKGLVSKGDGREVDHKNYNATDNRPSNLRIVSAKTNKSRQPKRNT